MTLVGPIALVLSVISFNSLIDAVPNKASTHMPDWSHPKGTSPWPEYGERPDTETPEVKAWVKSVDWSKVPKLPIRKVKNAGDAPECSEEAPKEDCWWTCSGCYAPDDIVDCPNKKEWGLTFDDGPQPGTTEKLLELLKDKNATATFFVTGMKSAEAPWLLQETINQGHHLASHSKNHSMPFSPATKAFTFFEGRTGVERFLFVFDSLVALWNDNIDKRRDRCRAQVD